MNKTGSIIIKETLIKNITIIVLGVLFFSTIKGSLNDINSSNISDLLLITSILLVTVCFANFTFSYKHSKFRARLLSHITTSIFMVLILFLLEVMVISIGIVYSSIYELIFTFSLLLYIGVALFDFWDAMRLAES
ncbi:hypothetical protein KKG41_00555 [Patescibacteria group bacterium]|nr:hypothetical protein [Patescibacteria group bacterium]MBU1890300.1 hypothetical protein [Patescibacteria group bacterium]